MGIKRLEALLLPNIIAIIGASENPTRAGHRVLCNLLAAQFPGVILPITPRYRAVAGIMAYKNIESLPLTPDLAILCTGATRNLALLKALGKIGCKAVIILSALPTQQTELVAYAQRYNMRLLGPQSLGIMAPWQNLNASFSPISILPGKLAFIAQSAAVANTILDWSQQRAIGFSYFIALGETIDIDVGELLDFLVRDSRTTAILLALEYIKDAKRFLSASRSASRNKPILVIKNGRSAATQQLLNYPPSLDATYDAVIQRAGLLRVKDTHELFSAVETLSHMSTLRGEKLMIVSNGAAPAAMALDKLLSKNGTLGELDKVTQQKLQQQLPTHIRINNPLNLTEDATVDDYHNSLKIVLDTACCDAILVIHAPSAIAPATLTAEKLIATIQATLHKKRIALLTNWCGEYSSQKARQLFSEHTIPTYRTPEGAVTAFMHMVEYRRNQKQLMETPIAFHQTSEQSHQVKSLINLARQNRQTHFDTYEGQQILNAYGLKIQPTWLAKTIPEALTLIPQIGFPLVVKLRSYDIAHKSTIQGVMLNIMHQEEMQQGMKNMLHNAKQNYPNAQIEGFLLQQMVPKVGTQELRVVVETDPTFGTLILLGEEELGWQKEQAAMVALPPLNMALARYTVMDAIKKGKIRYSSPLSKLNIDLVSQLLVQVSNLVVDCPEIVRLDIHPVLISAYHFTLLDISIELAATDTEVQSHLSIRPYPKELESELSLKDGTRCFCRPIRPEDEPLLKRFIGKVTKEDLYYRYFSEINEFTHEDLAKMTQIDYDREMAFVAMHFIDKQLEIIGVARILIEPNQRQAEFSILIRSDLKRLGLGQQLLEKILSYGKQHNIKTISGITMPHNQSMLALAKKLNFSVEIEMSEGIANLAITL